MADDFAEIVKRTQDITERFYSDLGGIPADVLSSAKGLAPYKRIIRESIEQYRVNIGDEYNGGYGLFDMPEWAQVKRDEITRAMKAGDIVAIDGTPVIQHSKYLTGEVYACAIGKLTSKDHDVVARAVKTSSPLPPSPKSMKDVATILNEIDSVGRSTSWPIAYMEYMERLEGFLSNSNYVILDGPIMPQNLVTRRLGRELINEMFSADRKRYISIVKNIHASGRDLGLVGSVLRPGELYVHHTVYDFLQSRLEKDYKGAVEELVNKYGKDIIRGVYRPGVKAFGFECHIDDLSYAIALLWLDRNNQPGAEIPFLLHQVDARIRAQYNPNEVTDAINAILIKSGEETYFDAESERKLR